MPSTMEVQVQYHPRASRRLPGKLDGRKLDTAETAMTCGLLPGASGS